jgi:hypothetical protein
MGTSNNKEEKIMNLEEFEALSVVGKTVALGLVDAYKAREKADKEVLVNCDKRDHLCFRSEDVAVVYNIQEELYMACVLMNEEWRPTNTYYPTADQAYLDGLGMKHLKSGWGAFALFASKMLEIEP